MAADRDLAVATVRAWSRGTPPDRSGWEVTPATGVRGLRLLVEGDAFSRFSFTEPGPAAFEALLRNLEGHPGAVGFATDGRIAPRTAPFDYVDIDPYGSPLPFLSGALGALRPGGWLAVTATDLMVLAGAQPSATERLYGARPVRGRLGPEGGLRILLGRVAREAAALGRSVAVRLAYVRAHYVRAYVEVGAGPGPGAPVGTIDPAAWTGPRLGGRGPFGPMWLGPLLDADFVRRLEVPPHAARPEEVGAFLARLREESSVAAPFYYEANVLASELGLERPPPLARLLAGLRAEGFRASRTHVRPEGVRTDAPRTAVERIARGIRGAG
jgi:tRNA (guanine26-N2/guanine27-N2)-dimethyltransferase